MGVAMRTNPSISLSAVLLLSVFVSCSHDDSEVTDTEVSSRSYRGHETDLDSNNLVGVYPSLVGSRLDDCQTCHSGKIEDRKLAGSSCDHCHELLLHGTGHDPEETLNGYGRDYLSAGRSKGALRTIEGEDSDGDGFLNREELSAGRFPGSSLSAPGQAVAKVVTVSLKELKAGPSHGQFMMINNTQQRSDDYATFTGITIEDLFRSKHISIVGATGITVIAPDGYMKSLPIEYVGRVFPRPAFHSGLGVETLGPECGLITYPETLPDGLADGSPIPGEQRLMLGWEKNGVPLEPARLDATEGKILGEGPFRMVVPQLSPGMADRGSSFSPSGCSDGFDFKSDADHNAGSMVRTVIAIRIDPMPAGVEEFDYMNGGWAYINAGQLIIYGHGVG